MLQALQRNKHIQTTVQAAVGHSPKQNLTSMSWYRHACKLPMRGLAPLTMLELATDQPAAKKAQLIADLGQHELLAWDPERSQAAILHCTLEKGCTLHRLSAGGSLICSWYQIRIERNRVELISQSSWSNESVTP